MFVEGGTPMAMPSSSRMRPDRDRACRPAGSPRPPLRLDDHAATFPDRRVRVLQLPFAPKYCWVAKAQSRIAAGRVDRSHPEEILERLGNGGGGGLGHHRVGRGPGEEDGSGTFLD